jgi:hypothetical protein
MMMFKRRRLQRAIASMDHRTAFATLRSMAAAGSKDNRTMLFAAERALATAPDGDRYAIERWLTPLRESRTVRSTVFPMTLTKLNGVDAASVEEIEEAMQGVDRS